MHRGISHGGKLALLAVLFAFGAAIIPHLASAVGTEADAMCNPVKMECGCMQIMVKGKCKGGPNMYTCPCFDVTSGFKTTGICMAPNKCLGQSAGGMPPMLPMIPMMMPMMDMPQDPCTQQGGMPRGNDGTASTSSSTPQTNPCDTGGNFDFGTSYFQSTYFNDDDDDDEEATDDDGGEEEFIVTATATNPAPKTGPGMPTATTTGGLTGAIKIGATGATIVANLRQGLTEVAGFFGGNVFNSLGARSVVGRLCATRPWARANPLSKLIPDSFFDMLCSKAGYQVGVAVPQPGGGTVVVPKTPTKPATTTKMGPMNLGPIDVDIWAEPSAVRLGTRTYIFWNARGVMSCEVTGPNFTQKSLSGGASTVPITGPTTYTLACAAPDGSTVKDSVTVNLAI